ncbi:MAG: hypothetical protein EOM30_01785 [Clostridia bacterium]|nr:hypothetical protein [Clostridia bacterium]NLS86343.1 hypothetical protein [Oscillospiraceae bacterium]
MRAFTDIAAEIYSKSKGSVPSGVHIHTASAAGVDMTRVDIERAGLRPRASRPICAEVIGIPVLAIGVPTVMQANSITVTPKDIDLIAKRGAQLLSLAINKALQPALRVGELEFLTN